MGGASSEACGREFIMKKLPSYMRVTRGLALANQKNALAVNNFECRWNFGEGEDSTTDTNVARPSLLEFVLS